jgi:anaphase-promoting complex subunit 1
MFIALLDSYALSQVSYDRSGQIIGSASALMSLQDGCIVCVPRLHQTNVRTYTLVGSSSVDDRLPVWPPDMTAMFYGRINNPDWKLPWYDIRKLASQFKLSPSYAYGKLEPLAYLRQLTLIYRCLADKTVEDSRKRAENAMHLMVSHHIGLGFFNLLPLGLAAPLREAARSCQLAPGQDWPAAAYEFVGRNDLAEGANANPADLNATGYLPVKEFLVSNFG